MWDGGDQTGNGNGNWSNTFMMFLPQLKTFSKSCKTEVARRILPHEGKTCGEKKINSM